MYDVVHPLPARVAADKIPATACAAMFPPTTAGSVWFALEVGPVQATYEWEANFQAQETAASAPMTVT